MPVPGVGRRVSRRRTFCGVARDKSSAPLRLAAACREGGAVAGGGHGGKFIAVRTPQTPGTGVLPGDFGSLRDGHLGLATATRRALCAAAALLWLWAGTLVANPVLEWNEAFLQCVRKEMPPPCLVARNLAILHLAIHRAVGEAQARSLSAAEMEAVADAAGDEVCRTLFPTDAGEFARVIGTRAAASHSTKATTALAARRTAQAVLESRANDGATTGVSYIPSERPGRWRRTEPRSRPPELPHWGQTKPFLLESSAQFRPPPPPASESDGYARELNEVRRLGSASGSSRTEEQTLVGGH